MSCSHPLRAHPELQNFEQGSSWHEKFRRTRPAGSQVSDSKGLRSAKGGKFPINRELRVNSQAEPHLVAWRAPSVHPSPSFVVFTVRQERPRPREAYERTPILVAQIFGCGTNKVVCRWTAFPAAHDHCRQLVALAGVGILLRKFVCSFHRRRSTPHRDAALTDVQARPRAPG